ncbi:protein phosphatase 1 regulatory subunit 1A [Ahaetulla prasina]|uniref:protein phosphatase 1 regulatory subunit 1A n=1 Tax=Ahaetulla prasina TaxID=499056 RepID=UPI0026480324|nr:protein phosphatase 1 regulatory subunit 1A [Ahaetulla prasina]
MEPNSPRKIQFTVPLLEPHLDPEAAEQIRRRRPTPATLVLSSDQSSPEIDEDRIPNPLLKPSPASPLKRCSASYNAGCSCQAGVGLQQPLQRSAEIKLQLMVEHHLCKQQGDEEEEDSAEVQESHSPSCCPHANIEPTHSPESCPLAQAHAQLESQKKPHSGLEEQGRVTEACGAGSSDKTRSYLCSEKQGIHISPENSVEKDRLPKE